jgi:hypothetical protein
MPSPEARAVNPAARLAVSGDGTALMLIGGGSTQALAASRLARIASARPDLTRGVPFQIAQ